MIPLNLPKYNWIEYQQDVNFFKQLQNSLPNKCFNDTSSKDYFKYNCVSRSLFKNLIKNGNLNEKLTPENHQVWETKSFNSER